jgi:2-hydroxy-3-keto-5-methylthiopentenyl-1-phosphate phosphatase
LGAAPHWTALTYAKPDDAVEEIKQELAEKIKTNPNLKPQFSHIVETYADFDPLIEAGLEPLLKMFRKPDDAVEEIKEQLEAKIKDNPNLKPQFSHIVDSYADFDPLIEAGLEPLFDMKEVVDVDSLIEEMLARGGMDF